MHNQRVRDLWRNGLDSARDAIMVHGTNTDAISFLTHTGYLPPSVKSGQGVRHSTRRGYMYFFPLPWKFHLNSSLPQLPIIEAYDTLEEYEESLAQGYARFSEEAVIAKELLGVSYAEASDEVTERADSDRLMQHIRTFNPRGVILGINEAIAKKRIEPGEDDPDVEAMVLLPKGIPIEYISYILPMGERETKRLEQIVSARDFVKKDKPLERFELSTY